MATLTHSTIKSRRPTGATPGLGRRTLSTFVNLACMSAPGRTAVPTSDAGLIHLCTAFHDADARCHAAADDGAEWRVWLERRQGFQHEIEGIKPNTLPGRLVKAGVALVLLAEVADLENAPERFSVVVLRDLVVGGAA